MGQHYGLLTLGVGVCARLGRYLEYEKRSGLPVRVDTVFTEIPRPMEEIPELLQRRKGFGQDHGVILISEGVIFQGVEPPRETNIFKRLLNEAGNVSRWVRQRLLTRFDIRNTRAVSLGYVLRGAPPNAFDIELATRLSEGALELLALGSFGRMSGVGFVGNTARLTMTYPKLNQVADQDVRLNQEYFEYVRSFLEESE